MKTMHDREKVIAWLADEELYYRDHGDTHNSIMACNALALLTEHEEKLLRCDKCTYHREDGWCGMHGRWVTETDYCSLGAWKGR